MIPLAEQPMNPAHEQIMRALATVFDPELGMSIVDLGLVYDVAVENGRARITMTLTTPGCPLHDSMKAWVSEAVRRVPGVDHVDVTITFDPPWTPGRLVTPR
jgi:metal-sulfur cluster biosynthetic enzyme